MVLMGGFSYSLVYIGSKSASAGVELVYNFQPKPDVFILESMHGPFFFISKYVLTGLKYIPDKYY